MGSQIDDTLRALFKGGGLLFAGLVIELGVSFLAKAVIARVLGPIDYGAVSLGVTTLSLLSTLCLLGLHSGIGRYLPRFDSEENRKGVIVSGFQIAIPIATFTGLAVGALANPIATYIFTDPSVAPFLRIFGLCIPFAALVKLSVGVIRGIQQATPRVIVQNIIPPITRFSAVAVAVVFSAGALGVAVAYAVAYVIAALVGLYYVVNRTEVLSNVKPTRLHGELLSFSAPLIVSAAMGFILADLDTFMLAYFTSTSDVGVYNVVYPIAQLLTVSLSSFGFLFMPIISELDAKGATDDMSRIYQVVTKWVVITTLPVFLVIVLFPEMTIATTFGREYIQGGTALSLLSVAYFSHTISGPNFNTLTSIGQTRLVMWDNISAGVLNAILNLLLIPDFGYLGAGAATAISYIVLNMLYSAQLYLETGIQPISTALVRIGIVTGTVITLLYWGTITFLPTSPLILVVIFACFVALYMAVILRFGGIEEEEVMLVLSFEERFGVDLGPMKDVAKLLIR